jgi:hypothetical protein
MLVHKMQYLYGIGCFETIFPQEPFIRQLYTRRLNDTRFIIQYDYSYSDLNKYGTHNSNLLALIGNKMASF